MASRKHTGKCHCGAVQFEVQLSDGRVARCNCTICRRTGMTGAMVKPPAFRLVSGEANLSTYEWGARISKRYFCRTCGIHCFGKGYLEQVGGDYVSVNLHCVDDFEIDEAQVVYWDGRHDNWMAGPRSTPWSITTASAAS